MKKQSLILLIGLFVSTSSLFAQKVDHPLIGHLDGAELWVQNIHNIHEYTIITGQIKNDSLVSDIKTIGKTTMTAYKYKGDNSAFGIMHNYTIFLEEKGFEILYSCKSGECGGDLSKHYLSKNKFETSDNSVSPAFWDAGYFRNYLSAKKQENGKTVYVCIFIAQGWWDFPVYRIDVIEKEEATSMILNDNLNQENNSQEADISSKITETNNNKSNSFSIQAGLSQYNFYDPHLYGEHVVSQSNGVFTGVLSGFRDLAGIYIKTAYLFNENIGITADIALHHGENGSYIENATSSITYETNADLNFQRIGIMGRFVGEKYPIKLSFSPGIGRGVFDAYYLIETNTYRLDYQGKVDFPMVYFQAELTIPIFKGLFLFSEYEYTVGWTEEFSLIHNNGGEYHEIKYKYPGLGGNNFRFGLGYEFGGQ